MANLKVLFNARQVRVEFYNDQTPLGVAISHTKSSATPRKGEPSVLNWWMSGNAFEFYNDDHPTGYLAEVDLTVSHLKFGTTSMRFHGKHRGRIAVQLPDGKTIMTWHEIGNPPGNEEVLRLP